MSKQFVFTDDQKEYLFENYLKFPYQYFADLFGCSKRQISLLLQRNGLSKGKGWTCHGIFSESDDEYIRKNYLIKSYTEIAKDLGYTRKQVDARARYIGLRKNRQINDDYFDKIDTPLKAYFLGFIYADGWVVYKPERNNYEFGMQLQAGDSYVLEKLNYELGNQNIIAHKKPHDGEILGKKIHIGPIDSLRVYSKHLVESLMANGIETNKSQKDVYPIVEEKFFFDFLRGYIDGDGCFYTDDKWTYMHITSASIAPLEYIQKKLLNYDIETRMYTENEKKHRLMCINTNEVKKLVSRLYYEDGLFCLSRKYEKIEHLLGSAA